MWQDPTGAKMPNQGAQRPTAKVKQEGGPAGLPQQPAWPKQYAHPLGPAPGAAARQHLHSRQQPPHAPQQRPAAPLQQPFAHAQHHYSSATPVRPGGAPAAFQHAMAAQQHYQATAQHNSGYPGSGGAVVPALGYAAGWPKSAPTGGSMQYGQGVAYSGQASHGVPYPGPPAFLQQRPAMTVTTSQQGSGAASWAYGQAAGHPPRQHHPMNGMQQPQESSQQAYAPAVMQQQPAAQPGSSGQQAGSMLGAGLVLSTELMDSLKSLAPALQQLKQPGTT